MAFLELVAEAAEMVEQFEMLGELGAEAYEMGDSAIVLDESLMAEMQATEASTYSMVELEAMFAEEEELEAPAETTLYDIPNVDAEAEADMGDAYDNLLGAESEVVAADEAGALDEVSQTTWKTWGKYLLGAVGLGEFESLFQKLTDKGRDAAISYVANAMGLEGVHDVESFKKATKDKAVKAGKGALKDAGNKLVKAGKDKAGEVAAGYKEKVVTAVKGKVQDVMGTKTKQTVQMPAENNPMSEDTSRNITKPSAIGNTSEDWSPAHDHNAYNNVAGGAISEQPLDIEEDAEDRGEAQDAGG